MASVKSKILVVGGTGYLGRHVVAASARLGHPTVALVRDTAPSDPAKAALLKSFQDAGVTLLKGDLYDQASLVSAVKGADVVISTLGSLQIADQTRLIDAIKEAGNVKTFQREYVPEEAVLKQIQESPIPLNIILAIGHAAYVLGEQTGFEIDPAKGVDATELYPEVKYTTVDEYLNRFL